MRGGVGGDVRDSVGVRDVRGRCWRERCEG